MRPPFLTHLPDACATSVVVASPHSGRFYPETFIAATRLDRDTIRSSEDAYVDLLIHDAPSMGAPLLLAIYPRAYLDLNRSRDELDPALIEGVGRGTPSARVDSGLGVVPRVVANGRPIYAGKLTRAEAEARIQRIWDPYHDALQGLLAQAKRNFGASILLDFHSTPRAALEGVKRRGQQRPEIVLGDRFGTSASGEVMQLLQDAFAAEGFNVMRNVPFSGAYVITRYGRPGRGQHAIQIEIDRSLYMDEQQLRTAPQFETVRTRIGRVIQRFIRAQATEMPVAAE